MTKCEILNEAHNWTEKTIKNNPAILKNLGTLSKQSAGILKNNGIQQYLSLDGVYDKVFRENEKVAFKVIMDFIKSNKNKYTKDEILLFLGYVSRELTYYERTSSQVQNYKQDRYEKSERYEDYRTDKNKGLMSKPFANLGNMIENKERR